MTSFLHRSKSPRATPDTAPPRAELWRRRGREAWRLVLALAQDVGGGLDLRATSLVYTTLLSLAPLLAVSFSVLKAFGAHNQMRPFLLQMLEPLGAAPAADITDRIIGFVDNLDVGVLGSAGFALLFYTVLSLLQKIEDSFNHIWRVATPRSFRRRFSEYLSVLLVGPVLVFSALGLMASMTNHAIVRALVSLEPFGTLFLWLGKLLPTLLMMGAFAFLYVFVPNTQVRWAAALAGGAAAGLAWRLAGWLFGAFVAGSSQYQAIYSSFAILVVFMIWLYVNWLILLLGVDLSFYAQNPRYLARERELRAGYRLSRRIGLAVLALLAERFQRGATPWTLAELAARLKLSDQTVADSLAALERRGLILGVDRERGTYMPARELDAMPLGEVLDALETAPGDDRHLADPALAEPAVEWLERRLGAASRATLAGTSVKSWLAAAGTGDRETAKTDYGAGGSPEAGAASAAGGSSEVQ